MMPVAYIKTIAEAHRVMAARRRSIAPGIVLTSRPPLPRYPPAPDLAWIGRIDKVKDHDDVADIAFDGWRHVGITAIEIITMDATAGSLPFADRLGSSGDGDIVDGKT